MIGLVRLSVEGSCAVYALSSVADCSLAWSVGGALVGVGVVSNVGWVEAATQLRAPQPQLNLSE